MAEKQSLVEETLLQIKTLEDVVSENAKGILQSTMKEEIGELVKESLKEAEEESEDDMDIEDDSEETDIDTDTEDEPESDMEDEEDSEMDMDMDADMDMDDVGTVDLTGVEDPEELMKVFQAMGPDDGIIVKKDDDMIDLQDRNKNAHYKIQMGEQRHPKMDEEMYTTEEESEMGMTYEMDDESEMDMEYDMNDYEDFDMSMMGDDEESLEDEGFEEISSTEPDEEDELVFEIELDEESDVSVDDESIFDTEGFTEEESNEVMEFEGDDNLFSDEGGMYSDDEQMYYDEESEEEESYLEEAFKAKGMGMGKPSFKYSSKPNQDIKVKKMKQGTRGVGMGKPKKFEFKEQNKPMTGKTETAEASRTLGAGRRWGRKGLNKPIAAPRHLKVETLEKEVNTLREKNEEYRKALNVFRNKLNEVAVFNSNLAYATRLFTEHSTTKQEKINILRRFDSIESLKESKSLYKTIKDELSTPNSGKLVKEQIQEQIERTPSSGSAANLIESKTYENPQFLRMRDLMSKINVIK